MSTTQRFGAWCGKEISELKRYSVENFHECAGRCKEACSRVALQREQESVLWYPPMVVARSGKHFLPYFSTEGFALEKMMLKKVAT